MMKWPLSLLENIKIEQDILQGIGIALLTILIPVAIAIFDREKYNTLDKYVILDHVVEAKYFMIFVGLIFFPLLFWNMSSAWLRLIEVIAWGLGISFILRILLKSYHWLKGHKSNLRLGYLQKLKNTAEMEEVWRSVWQSEKIDPESEEEFFSIFHSIIDKTLKNENR